MARVGALGWDTGSLSAEPASSQAVATYSGPGSVGSVALESTIVRTGTGSLKVTPASGAAGWWEPRSGASANAPVILRFYVRVTSLPASTRVLFGDLAQYNIAVTSTGALQLRQATTSKGTSSQLLNDTNRWYRVELKLTAGAQELKIDGISEATDNAAALAANRLRFGSEDTVAATYTAYFDDFTRDNANYPGEGKVVLLVPISDNARDTLWTGGAGGTSNLFSAVDNKPPAGTASETDSTQIEHAGGAAGTTDHYDANMTTYANAGIGVNDIVNLVYPFVWVGEDSSTGDKLLNHYVKSNPAQADPAFNYNVGASALGTWPSNWNISCGPATDAPSVVIASSPVMTIIRPETASRVASCCFMGIYVDYTPMGTDTKQVNQAVNRAATY